MKVTKYPQSCLLLEKDGKRLLIDPGSYVADKFTADQLGPVDAVLITHEHADHADPELIALVARDGIPVVANESTQKVLGDVVARVIADGESLELAGFQVTARELSHMLLPDGSPGPQNTGYIIDGTFFHPGDGLEVSGVQVHASGVPVAGPDASPRGVVQFIKSVGAKKVIPLHFDNHMYPGSPEAAEALLGKVLPDVEVVVLHDGESAEV